jgi:hypothetical protein
MKITSKPAKGTIGFIMRVFDGTNDTHVFRVYDKDHNFIDYDINHYDLQVVILEDDATFYETEKGNYLDHGVF